MAVTEAQLNAALQRIARLESQVKTLQGQLAAVKKG